MLLFFATQDLCAFRFDDRVRGPEGPLAQFIDQGKQSIVFFLDHWLRDQERSTGFMYRVGDGKFVASSFMGPDASSRCCFWQVLWCLCLVTAGFIASCSMPDVHILLVCQAGKHRSFCMASAMHTCFRMLSKIAKVTWQDPMLMNIRRLEFTLHWDASRRVFAECLALRRGSFEHTRQDFRQPRFITQQIANRLAQWIARTGRAAHVLIFTISDAVIRPLLPETGYSWQAVVQACAALCWTKIRDRQFFSVLKDLDVETDERDEVQLAQIMQCVLELWPRECSLEAVHHTVVFPFDLLWTRFQRVGLINSRAESQAATGPSPRWGDALEAEATAAPSGKKVRRQVTIGTSQVIAVDRLLDVVVLQVGSGVLLSFREEQRSLQSLEDMLFLAPANPGFQRHAMAWQRDPCVQLGVCQDLKDECGTLQIEFVRDAPGWAALLHDRCDWMQCQAYLFFHMLSIMSLEPSSWFTVSATFLSLIAVHVVEHGMSCPLSLMHCYMLYLYLSRDLENDKWFQLFPGFLKQKSATAREQWQQIHDLFLQATEAGIKLTGFQIAINNRT